MISLWSLLATASFVVLCPGSFAFSYYPYLNAEQLYKMQLLANAYEYPGDKLSMDGLGGGAMDVPYSVMGGANGGLVDIDEESDPTFWPEELVAELAAAAEREKEGVQDEAEEAEDEEGPAEEAEVQKDADSEEAAVEKQAQKVPKDAINNRGAQLRDQEHLEHSALHGYQSVSGGTVNGQNKQSKSDKALPAYCNPPNPCPVGKTAAEDNCVENFENSAENNQRLLSQQECPCDTEHMFTCPEGSQTVSSKTQGSATAVSEVPDMAGAAAAAEASQDMQLNKVIAQLSDMENEGDNLENNPSFSATRKRMTLMAKKSPHYIHKRSERPYSVNPYLMGQEINIAAKKDPKLAKNRFNKWEFS